MVGAVAGRIRRKGEVLQNFFDEIFRGVKMRGRDLRRYWQALITSGRGVDDACRLVIAWGSEQASIRRENGHGDNAVKTGKVNYARSQHVFDQKDGRLRYRDFLGACFRVRCRLYPFGDL